MTYSLQPDSLRPDSNINWNQIWAHEIERWHQSAGKSCQQFWADKESAHIFARHETAQHQTRLEKTLATLEISPGMRVLDIGAGPGNLAIPMAKTADHVTAVEPSPGMAEVMADQIAEKNIANITPVQAAWEDVDISALMPPYDLVVASLSLGMADLAGAIEKMNQVCSGKVVLFWHAGIPEWEDMPRTLWPEIFGRPYHSGPKSDIIFQILYQVGIFPETKVFTNYFCEIFDTMDAAVTFYARRFKILSAEHRPVLEAYLKSHCKKNEQGLVHGFHHTIMKFSWQPDPIKTPAQKGQIQGQTKGQIKGQTI